MASGREDEFRELFAREATTRLQRLSEQLLQLEAAGNDIELVASVFRDAHTLKGSAAMVGRADVAQIAHAMEDLLEELRSGTRVVTSSLIDVLLTAVDVMREVLHGPDGVAGSRIDDVVARLVAQKATAEPADEDAPVDVPEADGASAENEEGARRPVVAEDTVRVPVRRLDELVRLVGEAASAQLRLGRLLTELGRDPGVVSEYRELGRAVADLQERTMRARMVPITTITDGLHRAVRDLARSLGKSVRWEVRGEDTELDRRVLDLLTEALLHLVRNAVDHGAESPAERVAAGKPEQATVRLHAMQIGSEVILAVSDDGRGIDLARVRQAAARGGSDTSSMDDAEARYLVFRSGVSTAGFVSDISGRGVGLDVVRSSLDSVRGRVEVDSTPGESTEFRIVVPITLSVLPCLLVRAGSQRFAIPMHSVVTALGSDGLATSSAEGRDIVLLHGAPIQIAGLADVLGNGTTRDGPAVVVSGVTRRHALRVDELLGHRDVVVKGLSRALPRLACYTGASVEPDGSILLVLDAPGVIDRARRRHRVSAPAESTAPVPSGRRGRVLIVDDALTVRELQRTILERAGYDVGVASDGVEALSALGESPYDLVLTDVEMPRLDGFGLTEAIRATPSLVNLAVVILTSRVSDDDRRRGLEAGADGYIVKSAFDESQLLQTVERLLGSGG